jgi:hypothetical protein
MRDKIDLPAPESSEQSLPFFARFLEGGDGEGFVHDAEVSV